MKRIKVFALLMVILLTACAVISSFDSTTIEQLAPQTVRVTTRVPGLLTVYSTKKINDLAGKNLNTCEITTALGKPDQGVICKNVPTKFIVDIETLGSVTARVTN